MNVRQGWVVLTGVALAVASACGTDDGKVPPGKTGDAGGAGEGPQAQAGKPSSQAGAGGAPDSAAGGMPSDVAGGAPGGAGGIADPGAPGGAGGEGGAPVVVSKDINGRVYGLSNELVVLIDGVNVPIDADGRFSVVDGPEEYQLEVCAPDYKFVQIFDGLRTRAPVVDLNTGSGDPPYAATIRGKVTGGLATPFDIADDEVVFTQLAYSSNANGYLYPLSSIDPPEGFDLNPLWGGSATDTGEVLAIQYLFKSKVGVTEYTGFARRPMTIVDGNIYGSVNGSALTDLQLTAPAVTTFTGQLSLPSGWDRDGSYLHVGPFMVDSVDEGAFSVIVPKLQDVPMWVLIQASGPEGSADFKVPVPNKSPWNITVPNPPKPLVPVDAANAVTRATIFSWNSVPTDSVAGVSWQVGDWSIERYTTAASTTLPDLSVFGVALPAASASLWRVEAVGPAATMDDVLIALHNRYLDTAAPGAYLSGVIRDFTTAP